MDDHAMIGRERTQIPRMKDMKSNFALLVETAGFHCLSADVQDRPGVGE